jgi:hypothetical protein
MSLPSSWKSDFGECIAEVGGEKELSQEIKSRNSMTQGTGALYQLTKE